MKKTRAWLLVITCICLMLTGMVPASAVDTAETTYVIPISGDIDDGNLSFIQNAYADAIESNAEAIIFEIDTYGGYLDTAISIKNLIMSSNLPTYCFVDSKAISAGSLIALAGEELIMRPGTTIGAAEPRLNDEKADEKTLSMWTTQLSAVAEARDKDGQIAAAWADTDIEIEGITEKGKLLTLSANQALQYGIADNIFDTRTEIIEHYNLPQQVEVVEKGIKDTIVSWLSSPYVAAILLLMGIAGIVIELLTAGSFGLFGAVGIVSFVLYFIGHFWAGNLGIGAILLFLAGILLIVLEIFVIPGFGVTGILGILSVFASMVFASPSIEYALISMGLALVGSILLIILVLKNKKIRKVWSKLILFQKQENEQGYIAPDNTLSSFLGKTGVAITTLRPAGGAEIARKRLDVVTMGEFIEIGTKVEVIMVEGTRVVVQALLDDGNKENK